MRITYSTYGSLTSVILENELVQAVILPSKGADLLEFTHRQSGINALYRSELPVHAYDGLDLSRHRLAYHSDRLLGGYMDVLPHRGLYKGQVLEQNEGGIAATLPWNMEVLESTDQIIRIKCYVLLPIFPIYVERTYTLTAMSRTLQIGEYVRNTGDAPMLFTWTQHALFGAGILRGNAEIKVPCDSLFKAWEQMQFPERPLEDFMSGLPWVKLRQGTFDLTRPPDDRCKDYEFVVFTRLQEGRAAIDNHDLGLGICLNWDTGCFPYLRAVYRFTGSGPMVGLEPSDDMFSGWNYSEHYHTYTSLAAGAELTTWFRLGFTEKETMTQEEGLWIF